ncbi:MAG: hypothetical protein KF846_18870 [Cyclobacteriaceae bacterium]|nr:hypothetical protein [Cyclobacteriaceae bacterium]
MKKINLTWLIVMAILVLPSCILEDEDDEYTIVGGVATVTVWSPSKLNPTANEAMTIRALYFSEHAPVEELRFYAKVGAADRELIETVAITNHNTADSYERVFNYTVPAGTPATTFIVFTIEVETPKDLVTTRSTPSTGASAVRVI